ncbi:unnamed protein product [Absidia cylindrospora]
MCVRVCVCEKCLTSEKEEAKKKRLLVCIKIPMMHIATAFFSLLFFFFFKRFLCIQFSLNPNILHLMISFSQTWHRIAKQLKRKRSFHSHENSKSVRFYDIETVFYTHSSLEYDRTPTAELHENNYLSDEDDEDDEDDDDDENIEENTPITSSKTSLYVSSSILPPSSNLCYDGEVIVVGDPLNWEKSLACLAP